MHIETSDYPNHPGILQFSLIENIVSDEITY